MSSKEERERAALAARAAARAQLSAAGQVVPAAAGPGAGALHGSSAGGLTDQTRNLLAARKAAGLEGAAGASAGSGGAGASASGGWQQSPLGFWHHVQSGAAQWAAPQGQQAPAPLPQGWFVADSAEGRYYYTAPFTNARGVEGMLRTWELPQGPPPIGGIAAGM